MTITDAIEAVRNALDHRPHGFVAVAIDVDVLETLIADSRRRLSTVNGYPFVTVDITEAEIAVLSVITDRYTRTTPSTRIGSERRKSDELAIRTNRIAAKTFLNRAIAALHRPHDAPAALPETGESRDG